VNINILDIPGMVVALAMIVGDVVLNAIGHPVPEFNAVIPVIATAYIAGRVGVHAGTLMATAGAK
jgi:uncharacterized membrane protein